MLWKCCSRKHRLGYGFSRYGFDFDLIDDKHWKLDVAVDNLHLSPTLSYSEFTAALGRRFNNISTDEYKLQSRRRVQKSQESPEAYADALQELALNAYPSSGFDLKQEMALDQLLTGSIHYLSFIYPL